jgi:RNA polymerase sigma factor (TIGR02999 family)
MTSVSQILSEIGQGDASAADDLLPLVYDELRKLAAAQIAKERPGQTLQATALVHEAYVRLVDGENAQQWNSRGHFFAAAAQAMRRILVENARRKACVKHGGQQRRIEFEEAELGSELPSEDLIVLDEALTRLAAVDPVKARLVELRFFTGMSVEKAATALNIAPITAKRYWRYARAWLHREISV